MHVFGEGEGDKAFTIRYSYSRVKLQINFPKHKLMNILIAIFENFSQLDCTFSLCDVLR